ncbi:LrgB family protein [Chitinibacteraceae bacterium HSL-7]
MNTLLTEPLFWLTLTAAVFVVADALYRRAGQNALLNPVLTSIAVLIAVLTLTGVSYPAYFAAAKPIHLLLGPATVALAVPLYTNLHHIRRWWKPLTLALLVGGACGIVSAVGLGMALGLTSTVLRSIAAKSVTTPIAMALTESIGGSAALAANVVIITGILGAVLAVPLLAALRLKDEAVIGFAMGVAAHGVGSARAYQHSPTAGAFAGLAMGLNGLYTSLLLPLLLWLWPRLMTL